MMEKIFTYFDKSFLVAISSGLFTIVSLFAFRFIKEQKKADEELLKAINGLGQRVNREIDKLEIMQKVWHKDHKETLQRIESKIDHVINYVHEMEVRVITKEKKEKEA